MSNITSKCANCRHFKLGVHNLDGHCHRYPPTAIYWPGGVHTEHPEVSPFNWCGEWQPQQDHAPGDPKKARSK